MKQRVPVAAALVALALASTSLAAAQTRDMKGMSDMPGVHHDNAADGVGTAKAIDTANGTITLQHQAIASIGWPAMTMAFKVASAALLKNAKAGDSVHFSLHPDGMNSTVTAIKVVTR
jgi:Cu(I)/Ag(I) efflux system protein CusF